MYYPKEKYLIKDIKYLNKLKLFTNYHIDKDHKFQVILSYFCKYCSIYFIFGHFVKYFVVQKFTMKGLDNLIPVLVITHMFVRNLTASIKHREALELREFINKHFWPTDCTGDKNFEKYVVKVVQLLEYSFISYICSCFLAGTLCFIFPIAEFGPNERTLPANIWYPFDPNRTKIHYTLLIILCCFTYSGIYYMVLIDLLFIYCTSHLCIQLRILQILLENIHIVTNIEIMENTDSEEYQNIIYDRLKICIIHHRILYKFYNKIQDFFSLPIFCQLAVSVLFLCITGYVTLDETDIETLARYITLLISAVFQICLYCIPGSFVEIESDRLINSIYDNNWYVGNTKFRKSLCILQTFAQSNPLFLTALGVFPLNNICLVQVFKLAFTYITMLQTLREQK